MKRAHADDSAELAFDDDEKDEKIRKLGMKLSAANALSDSESSRRINLDRENRELKAFISHYCTNSTQEFISSVYADPMLGLELTHFREGYLKLATLQGEKGPSPINADTAKMAELQAEVNHLRQRVGDPVFDNLRKQVESKSAEISRLESELEASKNWAFDLQKKNDELKTTALLANSKKQ
jgi:hypothetical protein